MATNTTTDGVPYKTGEHLFPFLSVRCNPSHVVCACKILQELSECSLYTEKQSPNDAIKLSVVARFRPNCLEFVLQDAEIYMWAQQPTKGQGQLLDCCLHVHLSANKSTIIQSVWR